MTSASTHRSSPSTTRHHSQANDTTSPSRHRDRELSPARHSGSSKSARDRDDDERYRIRRAAKACVRCRQSKLRCTAGNDDKPCARCVRAGVTCEFKARAKQTRPAEARVSQLESSVSQILASLGGVSRVAAENAPAAVTMTTGLTGLAAALQGAPTSRSSYAPARPMETHPMRQSTARPPEQPLRTNSMDSGPRMQLDPGPSSNSVPGIDMSPSESGHHSANSRQSKTSITIIPQQPPPPPGPSAEVRLSQTLKDRFMPPFRAISHNPGLWRNQEQDSRRASPEPSAATGAQKADATQSRSGFFDPDETNEPAWQGTRPLRDDPVENGIVGEEMALALIDHYIQYCHAFLPVVIIKGDSRQVFERLRRRSSFLLTVVIAVAARFTNLAAQAPASSPAQPSWMNGAAASTDVSVDRATFAQLANLAESHLAQSLLRKAHSLEDVMATLLLAGWGLRSGGGGPDSWILTGHAFRISRRLGLHNDELTASRDSAGWSPTQKERFLARRRVWLALSEMDCLLSLGFGRPSSRPQLEGIETNRFLTMLTEMPLSELPGAVGSFYVASQAELQQIARDFIRVLETIESQHLEDSLRHHNAGTDGEATINLFHTVTQLNTRLDGWCRRWIWPNAPYGHFLGSSARLARLAFYHVQLVVNAVMLRSQSRPSSSRGSVVDGSTDAGQIEEEMALVHKAVLAATTIIQIQSESSSQDKALDYATDYLSCTIAHAAVFLVRFFKLADQNAEWTRHQLETAIQAMERAERSHTWLATSLSKRMREVAGSAGISGIDPEPPVIAQRRDSSLVPLGLYNADLDLAFFDSAFGGISSGFDLAWMLDSPEHGNGVGGNGGGTYDWSQQS